MGIDEIINHPDMKFRYMMLGRMQADCEYAIGCKSVKISSWYAMSYDREIEYMKALWKSFDKKVSLYG